MEKSKLELVQTIEREREEHAVHQQREILEVADDCGVVVGERGTGGGGVSGSHEKEGSETAEAAKTKVNCLSLC